MKHILFREGTKGFIAETQIGIGPGLPGRPLLPPLPTLGRDSWLGVLLSLESSCLFLRALRRPPYFSVQYREQNNAVEELYGGSNTETPPSHCAGASGCTGKRSHALLGSYFEGWRRRTGFLSQV